MRNSKNQIIADIAIGVAVIIGGGLAIYQVSGLIPLPGFKYAMMSPFMSLMFYILIQRINSPLALLQVGGIFSLVMAIVNIFMGMAILITTALAQLAASFFVDGKQRALVGALGFSAFMPVVSLSISKYLIGGVFDQLSLGWMFILSLISAAVGGIGIYGGMKIAPYVMKNSG